MRNKGTARVCRTGPQPPAEHTAILFDARRREWLCFRQPRQVLVARTLDAVPTVLAEAERQVAGGNVYAVGFLAYEAAPALDASLRVRPDQGFPLAWFGVYGPPEAIDVPPHPEAGLPEVPWTPSVSADEHRAAVARIKHYIAQGDTYQVNYSYRLRATWRQAAWPFFIRLAHAQGHGYQAWLHTGDFIVASASPELFFQLDGRRLVSRPMKGTAARGLRQADDLAQAAWLRASEKNLAENVMIVDMVRNDMGRVADRGSVEVLRRFDVEKYPSLWQMTSTVCAATGAGLTELLRAMFPPASITGAPKTRTMQIIAELESSPRRIYTGTIGYWGPDRVAQFNVAIRTLLIDVRRGTAEYGVGGGIVWDSQASDEREECRTKTRVLTAAAEPFDLLETLRWTPNKGLFLLEGHLARLADSAAYFSRPLDLPTIRRLLDAATGRLPLIPHRVRLRVSAAGEARVECGPLEPLAQPYRLRLARQPIHPANPMLYHKTTLRAVYQQALAETPDCDDVLLWNERGELTESTIANVAVELGGQWLTPPIACGLLPGVYRAELLAQGRITAQVLRREDLCRASRIYLLNSVRGIWEASLLQASGEQREPSG